MVKVILTTDMIAAFLMIIVIILVMFIFYGVQAQPQACLNLPDFVWNNLLELFLNT